MFALFQLIQKLGPDPLRGVDHQQDQVRVLRACPSRRDHGAIQAPLRREDARRVDQQDL